uniref:CSON011653 protein n=1 Tax=Culicoides sonorensis TaxID=179676 RepID=A0A336M7N9_CULSO
MAQNSHLTNSTIGRAQDDFVFDGCLLKDKKNHFDFHLSIKIDQLPEVTTISPNGFWHLSLPHSLFLGGVHNMQTLPSSLREKGSFIGCIQKFVINEKPISIISEALGGSNVDNCPHACVARPCGAFAQCIPNLENYECQCNPNNNNAQLCNKAEEVPVKVLEEAVIAAHSSTEMSLIESDTTIVDDVLETVENEEDNNNNDDDDDGDIISSNKNKDYYYNDNESDDEDYINYESGSGMTTKTTYKTTEITSTPSTTSTTQKTTTTTRTKIMPKTISKKKIKKASIKSPYKKLIEDIESHYTLKGKYMLLDTPQTQKLKAASKKASEEEKKEKEEVNLENDQDINYIDNNNNHHISSDFIFNTNDLDDEDDDTEIDDEDQSQMSMQHAMRYQPEDDTVIDEILIDEMDKIMKDSNGNTDTRDEWKIFQRYVTPPSTPQPPSETSTQGASQKSDQRQHTGACFNGHDSYFHYSDAETMRQIISYQIDLNLRFKTHSNNGLILWSGRHSAQQDDDFLSLGIEEGFLHLRYNLGSGEVNIEYNTTVVSDGLWHRIRAVRNLQEGTLKVDGGKPIVQRSPGKLRQLNTDAGLYVGGMPDPLYYTRNRYPNGILGCISEVVLAGELKLDFDVTTCLDCAHNVEPGIL